MPTLHKLLFVAILLHANNSFLFASSKEANGGSSKFRDWSPMAMLEARKSVKRMIHHSYNGYLRHAFPMDELKPLSCSGISNYGGMSLTLLESLETLLLIGKIREFERAVQWIIQNVSFDLDIRINIFEANIRALGSLLSSHLLIIESKFNASSSINPSLSGIELLPGYSGQLLELAFDLGQRLLPAFFTKTNIPLAWVNLKKGVIKGDVTHTCTAGAGTLLLEFALLSRLTGQPIFEERARLALTALFSRRSSRDLLGNTIDSISGEWINRNSGAGPGIDSFYEYLLKAFLLLGEDPMKDMFSRAYSAAMAHLRAVSIPSLPWILEGDMLNADIAQDHVSSLQAFWPGMQASFGDIEEAEALHSKFWEVWQKFDCLPELFDFVSHEPHAIQRGYPLRPEFIESTYFLYKATNNTKYLDMGLAVVKSLNSKARTSCGFASLADAADSRQDDHMESFFLAETLKYLFLLFSPEVHLSERYVFSTEGHLYPIDFEKYFNAESSGHGCHDQQELSSRQQCRWAGAAKEAANSSAMAASEESSVMAQRRAAVQQAVSKQRRKLASSVAMDGSEAGSRMDSGVQNILSTRGTQTGTLSPPKLVGTVSRTLGKKTLGCRFSVNGLGHAVCGVWTTQKPWIFLGEKHLSKVQLSHGNAMYPECSIAPVVDGTVLKDGASFQSAMAAFGPSTASQERRVTAALFMDEKVPSHGCQAFGDSEPVRGRIVLLDRGGCSFNAKAANVQAAGGVGLIVANSEPFAGLFVMAEDESGANISILSVLVTKESGESLRHIHGSSLHDSGESSLEILCQRTPDVKAEREDPKIELDLSMVIGSDFPVGELSRVAVEMIRNGGVNFLLDGKMFVDEG